jgi:glycosyltransferase involved in cell wall biosynthesis
MRVAFVHPSAPTGEGTGSTHTATLLVEGLADAGHEVTAFCLDPGAGMDPGGVERRPLETTGVPYHTATRVNRAIRRALDRGEFDGYDVVHSYLPTTTPALAVVGRSTRAATVVSLCAYDAVCPKVDLRYLDREQCEKRGLLRCTACSLATSPGDDRFGAAYRTASRLGNLRQIRRGVRRLDAVDRFHALSDHVERSYAAFDFPRDRVDVVPNPVDERLLRSHESDFRPPFDLVYVGYLERRKGVDRLIPVLDRVRRAGVDARLTVVGDGGRRSAMERAAEERGLTDVVRFRGHVPHADVPAAFATHDLFVYPGRWHEPFGRVFLEALATGTPTVATDVGAAKQILGPGGVVTDSSTDALARTVVETLRDGDLVSLSEATGAVVKRYRIGRIIEGLESVYRAARAR